MHWSQHGRVDKPLEMIEVLYRSTDRKVRSADFVLHVSRV